MKVALVYNLKDHKLLPTAYSHTYKNQFFALIERFGRDNIVHITGDTDMTKIIADVIIFYDVHSCFHVKLPGIVSHKALKYDYFNDPHQKFEKYENKDGSVFKLGAKERTDRALGRKVNFIICPQKNVYYQYIAPYLGDKADKMLVWFPPSPKDQRIEIKPLKDRLPTVLANGHIWQGEEGFKPYEFRNWAYQQPYVKYVKHHITDKTIPSGENYQQFLSQYAGALALCDTQIVPKYFEIPLAGCVMFAQYHKELEDLGFKDFVNCVFVEKENLESIVKGFLACPSAWQHIADAGRKLVGENYTADKFADFIYKHAEAHI